MYADTAHPNKTYNEHTSKAISVDPVIADTYKSLNQGDACEIVEAKSMFVHNGKMYSNGPFIEATLNNQTVNSRRDGYGSVESEDYPQAKLANGTIRRNKPSGPPSFYFVIKVLKNPVISRDPAHTYNEDTSKAVSLNPAIAGPTFDMLKKGDTCEIVEEKSTFFYKGKRYSNGPFKKATLNNHQTEHGRYEVEHDRIMRYIPFNPFIDPPSFYFVITQKNRKRSRSEEPSPPHAAAAPHAAATPAAEPNKISKFLSGFTRLWPSGNTKSSGGTVKRRFRVQKRQKQTMRPCNIRRRRRQRKTHAIRRRH